jgi:hypothetical protein
MEAAVTRGCDRRHRREPSEIRNRGLGRSVASSLAKRGPATFSGIASNKKNSSASTRATARCSARGIGTVRARFSSLLSPQAMAAAKARAKKVSARPMRRRARAIPPGGGGPGGSLVRLLPYPLAPLEESCGSLSRGFRIRGKTHAPYLDGREVPHNLFRVRV